MSAAPETERAGETERGDARAVWMARGVVVIAALATFARGVTGELVPSWDDGRFIVDHPEVQRVSWDAFVAFWSGPRLEAYHPLHLLSYWLDVPWAGVSAPVIHATSLALWCGALLVVLALFRKLGLGLAAAVVATLFFGLHTVQVEAVTWATGRKEILAVGLAAGSALAHLGSTAESGPASLTDRRAWLSRVLYLLAALAKTTVLPLPLVLFAADVLLRRRGARDAALAQLPSLIIGLGLGGLVIGIWRSHEMIRGAEGASSSILLVLATVSHSLGTALWPASTSPIYPLARDEAPSLAAALVGCALLLGAMAAAWRWRERLVARRILFGLVAFVILLAPASNVIPVYFQWQDRYLALPLLGLAFALGALVDAAGSDRRAHALAALAVVALAARTVVYQGAWASDLALWEHAVQAQPRAFYAWIKLGEVRRDLGRDAAALRAYQEAIEIAPQIRLGHAAFLSALMRRDERRHELSPSRAIESSQRFMRAMDDPLRLRELAGDLDEAGYRDAVTFVLARSLDIEPLAAERLERAAAMQLAQEREWLVRFYLSRLGREPVLPALRAYVERERARAAGRPEPEPTPATPSPGPEAPSPQPEGPSPEPEPGAPTAR
jgi:protein O-mannosyl-transferase